MHWLWIGLLLALVATTAAALSPEECEEKGFSSTELLCGVCSKLQDIGGKQLERDCLQCCTRKYDTATLLLPRGLLGQSPAFQDFMTTKREKFSQSQFQVDVTHATADIQAKLVLSAKGKENEVLRVTKWSSNDLEDFLAQFFPIII